jgi:outer membrane biosynthesis protein TonB
MNKTLKIRTIALAVTAALVLPSAALAASGQDGYAGPNNVVTPIPPAPAPPAPAPTAAPAPTPAPKPAPKPAPTSDTAPASAPVSTPAPETAGVNVVSDTAAADTAEDSGGSLPFTGADLGVLAIAGAMMLALGFGLRRLTHRTSQI